jgi:hypothetical protein
MNTSLINTCLSLDPVTKRQYIGCYPSNRIPYSTNIEYRSMPYCFVLNEDPAPKEGSHWVCLQVRSKDSVVYFDSYGRPPIVTVQTYLDKFERVEASDQQLQSVVSTVCGQYCIYMVLKLCGGKPFSRILSELKKTKKRDLTVQGFVNARYGLDLPIIDFNV